MADNDEYYDRDDWTEIGVDKVTAETDLAILVVIDKDEHWLPKSQLEDWPDVGESGSLIIKTWLAEEREFV